MPEPTRIVLLRHGQTPLSIDRRYSGRADVALTETGREQAARAAARLANWPVSAIISSPLQRTRATAEPLAAATGLPVTVDERLIETDFGEWEGLTFAEAARRDPELHRAWVGDAGAVPPGGESFAATAERVTDARASIVAEHPGQTVVVVSHVTPIKSMLRDAMRVGPELLYGLHLDLASVSLVEYFGADRSVGRLVNDTSHLRSYPLD
ncbi:MAG: histidine phosphatase family protein [Gordonia sp. (in: high G+C Gram-positive bacteria)]|uniref:histidine phosphatase family protein n=1 Tax=Gordonia sp. (in: high G+C Gram-positive bacteria) TaxID=84139 RepID=UPI0039E64894